jgi:hypothetical protein
MRTTMLATFCAISCVAISLMSNTAFAGPGDIKVAACIGIPPPACQPGGRLRCLQTCGPGLCGRWSCFRVLNQNPNVK